MVLVYMGLQGIRLWIGVCVKGVCLGLDVCVCVGRGEGRVYLLVSQVIVFLLELCEGQRSCRSLQASQACLLCLYGPTSQGPSCPLPSSKEQVGHFTCVLDNMNEQQHCYCATGLLCCRPPPLSLPSPNPRPMIKPCCFEWLELICFSFKGNTAVLELFPST